MNAFDNVILSADPNPKYLEFWPVVASAWRKLFGVTPALVLVADAKTYPDLSELDRHGPVFPLAPVEGVPIANQAKLARYFLASDAPEEKVMMINDIDLLPLSRDYVNTLLGNRPKGTLVTIGSELYRGPEKGKAMAGYLTAEAGVFKRLVNPKDLDWPDWIKSFIGLHRFDHKEDISNPTTTDSPDCFSDESLMRYWLYMNPVPTEHRRMPLWPYTLKALDRADWQFYPQKLAAGVYKEAHLPRPYSANKEKIQPLVDYIKAQ